MYGSYFPSAYDIENNRTYLDELHSIIRQHTGLPQAFTPTMLACSECPERKEDRLPIHVRTGKAEVLLWFGRHKKCSENLKNK